MLFWIFLVLIGIVNCSIPFPIYKEWEYQNSALNSIDNDTKISGVDYRLPKHTRPTKYSITIETGIANNDTKFKGQLLIDLQVLHATKSLKFHMKELSINEQDTILFNETLFGDRPQQHKFENQTDIVELIFEENLKKGVYRLKLTYAGILRDELFGFYKSSYVDDGGVRRMLATTHFEPVYARYAFPCWDEPEYKAVFEITMKYGKNYHAISNMPVQKETVDEDTKTTEFKPTPRMSTYLVAFVVSDFANVTNEFGNFTVWTRKNLIHRAPYARDIGMKILRALEDYTGIGFALPKMDQISIPDFAAGAMENWGLVTYRDSALLYEENVTTTASQFGIAKIISHEFAHQWFGDLVGPEWWEWVWLNEGFATYFQYYILDKVEPTWKAMNYLILNDLQQQAFTADVGINARPMNRKVQTSVQIRSLFDTFSYQKAASVIHMMSCVLSDRVFQLGLQYYLKENAGRVANSDTLFKNLQKAATETLNMFESDFNVKKYMDPWVNQDGFPMIQVDIANNTITITQERFLFDEPTDLNDHKNHQWYIPLNFVTGNNPNFDNTMAKKWLKPREKLNLMVDFNNTWILFNLQRSGYYRVNYDAGNWKLIIDQLNNQNHTVIHELNRAQLIDDSTNMAIAGKLNFSISFNLMNYLHREQSHVPWVSALVNFDYLDRMLVHSKQYGKFKEFVASKLNPYMNNLNYEPQIENDHMAKMSRPVAIFWACKVGIKSCQEFVQKQLEIWLENPSYKSISVDILGVTLCSSLRYSNSTVWQKMYDLYNNPSIPYDRDIIFTSLGCAQSEDMLMNFLKLSLDKTSNLTFYKIAKSIESKNQLSSSVLLKFMLENTEHILKNDTIDWNKLSEILTQIGRGVTSSEDFVQLAVLISKLQTRGIPTSVTNAAGHYALINMNWIRSNQRVIEDWLSTWNGLTVVAKPSNSGYSKTTISFTAIIVPLLLAIIL